MDEAQQDKVFEFLIIFLRLNKDVDKAGVCVLFGARSRGLYFSSGRRVTLNVKPPVSITSAMVQSSHGCCQEEGRGGRSFHLASSVFLTGCSKALVGPELSQAA